MPPNEKFAKSPPVFGNSSFHPRSSVDAWPRDPLDSNSIPFTSVESDMTSPRDHEPNDPSVAPRLREADAIRKLRDHLVIYPPKHGRQSMHLEPARKGDGFRQCEWALSLTKLDECELWGPFITDEHVRIIASHPTIRGMRIYKSSTTERSIEHLRQMPCLRQVSWGTLGHAPRSLAPFRDLPALESIDVRIYELCDDAHVLGELSNLISFDAGVSGYRGGLSWTLRCPRLTKLTFSEGHLTDEDFAGLAGHPWISQLFLEKLRLTDRSAMTLSQLPRLEVLAICHTDFTSAGMEVVCQIPSLKRLLAYGSQLNDRAFGLLLARKLDSLMISEGVFSSAQVRQLRSAVGRDAFDLVKAQPPQYFRPTQFMLPPDIATEPT